MSNSQLVVNRRQFLNWVGVGFLSSFVLKTMTGCFSASGSVKATVREGGLRTVGTLAQLDRDGQILDEQIAGKPLLVIRNPAHPETLIAVNPICTHRDCAVDWKDKRKVFVCPCHDAEFDPSGQALTPPARKPLKTYEVKVVGDTIQVGTQEIA